MSKEPLCKPFTVGQNVRKKQPAIASGDVSVIDEGRWVPLWTTLPEVTKTCRELILYMFMCPDGCIANV